MLRTTFRYAATWLILLAPGLAAEDGLAPTQIVTREIEPSVDHNHCTTRQFQHMSFKYEGIWFVFYSNGKDFVYQNSADEGQTWQRAPKPVATAPNGSTSHDILRSATSSMEPNGPPKQRFSTAT